MSLITDEVTPQDSPETIAYGSSPFVFGSYVLIPVGAPRTIEFESGIEIILNTLFNCSWPNPFNSITEFELSLIAVTVTTLAVEPPGILRVSLTLYEEPGSNNSTFEIFLMDLLLLLQLHHCH